MGVRLSADWMTKADERILEYLESEVKATPSEMSSDDRIRYDRKYIQHRLAILVEAGLVTRVHRGVYTLSSSGQAYLVGSEDMRDEPEP